MFDAKSLLESIVRGAAPAGGSPHGGGLADVIGNVLSQVAAGSGQGGKGGLEDILRQFTQGQQGQGGGLADILKTMLPQGEPASRSQLASGAAQPAPAASGGLGDILGNLQKQFGGPQGSGGLMDVLGQVLAQATSGVKEGAQRIDGATGMSQQARDAITRTTGKSPEDVMQQIRDLIANNPSAAAAGAGGLGAVVLGTHTGRTLAASAARMGALVMIGGLAYKAYQNYSQGKPVLTGAAPEPAPVGSGFEPQTISHESAALYIRAMIAAAAADGRIDADEQQRILGGLKQAGLDAQAEEFLANELNNPATAEQLAAEVNSPEEALQVFTAARIAIHLENQEEHDFLVDLAQRLGLDPKLVEHVDAAAQAAKT